MNAERADADGHDDTDRRYAVWEARFSELDNLAAAAMDAKEPIRIGHTYVDLADHMFEVEEYGDVLELLMIARNAFLDADEDELAARCAMSIGIVATEAANLEMAVEAYAIAADEWADVGGFEYSAAANNNAGAIAMQVGDYDQAEARLTDAIEVFAALGLHSEIPDTRVNLANVYRLTGRYELAEREFRETRLAYASDRYRAAQCSASLAGLFAEMSRLAESERESRSAIAMFVEVGADSDVQKSRVALAYVLMMQGEWDQCLSLLSQARQYFDNAGALYEVAVCDYNLANLCTYRHDFVAADTAFDRAVEGLRDAGMHHQIAHLQWNRTKRYMTEAGDRADQADHLTAKALDSAVSALIAAEYQRFQFADARRRLDWTNMLASRLATTFDLAHTVGASDLIADLIEVGISAGVYSFAAQQESLTQMVPFDEHPAEIGPPRPEEGPAMTLGAASLLVTALLPVAPPPALMGADDRIVLERQRAMAGEIDPQLANLLAGAPRLRAW